MDLADHFWNAEQVLEDDSQNWHSDNLDQSPKDA
jgi:hypothetical protein